MQIKSRAWVAAVLGAAVLAGGCSPQMKTAGYLGGGALLLGGVAARMNAEHGDHGLEDLGLVLGEYYFGTAAAVTGAIIVVAALMSPSESAPAAAPLPVPALVPPPAPPAPSLTPANPPPPAPALSMREPSSLTFR